MAAGATMVDNDEASSQGGSQLVEAKSRNGRCLGYSCGTNSVYAADDVGVINNWRSCSGFYLLIPNSGGKVVVWTL